MLVQEVAAQYPGKVTFVSENFGASKLAERYGVKGYPAVFVDDVLVAVPRDFCYFGEVEGTGRYAPWRNADNQAKFKSDLTRMIDLILAGKKDVVSQERSGTAASMTQLSEMPKFSLTDLSGKPLTAESIAAACANAGAGLDLMGDIHASAEYRAAMVGVYARRALAQALERAQG